MSVYQIFNKLIMTLKAILSRFHMVIIFKQTLSLVNSLKTVSRSRSLSLSLASHGRCLTDYKFLCKLFPNPCALPWNPNYTSPFVRLLVSSIIWSIYPNCPFHLHSVQYVLYSFAGCSLFICVTSTQKYRSLFIMDTVMRISVFLCQRRPRAKCIKPVLSIDCVF